MKIKFAIGKETFTGVIEKSIRDFYCVTYGDNNWAILTKNSKGKYAAKFYGEVKVA